MFRKRSAPPNLGGQVCLQKHTCLLLVLQLLRQERGEKRAPKSASHETPVKTQTCSEFVTTWGPKLRREAQPTLSEKQPNPTRAKATLLPVPPCSWPLPGHGVASSTPSPGATAKLAGREGGTSERPLGSKGKGALIRVYSLPWSTCKLDSPKMVFTTQLVAINYSRPRFPQTHRLSLLAR